MRDTYVFGAESGVSALDKKCLSEEDIEDLENRTTSWIPELSQIFSSGNAFGIFGAGHLVGPNGVIELLRAQGFTVTREINP
jgi:uncharacterized protein